MSEYDPILPSQPEVQSSELNSALMSTCPHFDCKAIFRNYDIFRWNPNDVHHSNMTYGNFDLAPSLQPNPDIAGIGVLLNFVITGYITTLLVIFCYLFFLEESTLTPVDKVIIQTFFRRSPGGHPRLQKWRKPVTALLLAFSDQQIVTGLAIVICGIYQLRCGISAYHWQMVVYLAWLSSTTHLGAITVLRDHFLKHRRIGQVRVFCMCLLAGFLVFTLVPTGCGLWLPPTRVQDKYPSLISGNPLGVPAKCYIEAILASSRKQLALQDLRQLLYVRTPGNVSYSQDTGLPLPPPHSVDTSRFRSLVLSIILLSFNVASRISLLSPSISNFPGKLSREILRVIIKIATAILRYMPSTHPDGTETNGSTFTEKCTNFYLRATKYLSIISYIVYVYVKDLCKAVHTEILFLILSTAWGSTNILYNKFRSDPQVQQAENFLSFGQLLPCILLILPFLTAWESFYEVLHEKARAPVSDRVVSMEPPCEAEDTEVIPDDAPAQIQQTLKTALAISRSKFFAASEFFLFALLLPIVMYTFVVVYTGFGSNQTMVFVLVLILFEAYIVTLSLFGNFWGRPSHGTSLPTSRV